MKQRYDEPNADKEAPNAELSCSEFRQVLEEYANDLREIIKKLCRVFN